MIKEIHNPADILVNGTSKFYQIILQLDNGSVGFWNGNGFDYIIDGFFKGRVLTSDELVSHYHSALNSAKTFASQFGESGIIGVSGVASFS
jgi:hypothetical protein